MVARGSDTIKGGDGDDAIYDDDPSVKSSSSTGSDKIVGGGGKMPSSVGGDKMS